MLVGEWLAVRRVERDVLRCPFKRCTEVEQFAIGAPASTFLGFLTKIPQVRNALFAKILGVFGGVHQDIHEAVEALGTQDCKGFSEFFNRADPTAEEVAIGQLHHTAVDKPIVKLLSVFLAAAQGAHEFPH